MKKYKILIADDHPIVLQGLRQALEQSPELQLIGAVNSGKEVLIQVPRLKPEAVVLDIEMPELDGLSVAARLQKEVPIVKIIFLTVYREESFLHAAINTGAQGYILKDSDPADIVAGIRTVCQGFPFISPGMTSYLLRQETKQSSDHGVAHLTVTELTILKLIAQYKTSFEIAATIFVSPRTVDTHRANMCQKLNLHGSHALLKFAIAHCNELALTHKGAGA